MPKVNGDLVTMPVQSRLFESGSNGANYSLPPPAPKTIRPQYELRSLHNCKRCFSLRTRSRRYTGWYLRQILTKRAIFSPFRFPLPLENFHFARLTVGRFECTLKASRLLNTYRSSGEKTSLAGATPILVRHAKNRERCIRDTWSFFIFFYFFNFFLSNSRE